MGGIEWAMWANEQAVISCGLLFLGGALSISSIALDDVYKHKRWGIGAYALYLFLVCHLNDRVISFLVLILEYPRSKRLKGNTIQRRGQFILTSFVSLFGIFGKKYVVRFVLYLLACIPCLLNLGSVIGGVSLLVAALIYLRAAIAGEEWVACDRVINRGKSLTRARPPSMAPPRLNPPSSNYTYEGHDDYENVPNAKNDH